VNKKQIMNLLGAGTVTALLVVTGLLFGGRSFDMEVADNETGIVQTLMVSGDSSLEAENAQLRDAVIELQQREEQYVAQIEQANQLLQENNNAYAGEAEYEEEYEECEEGEEYGEGREGHAEHEECEMEEEEEDEYDD